MTPSRLAAFRILLAIAKSRGNSDALLQSPQVTALSSADRNLTTTLVMGTLRWQIVLDAEIRKYLSRPDASLPIEASVAMRLGAFQLMFLERVPVHAALNESVELVKQSGAPHTAGLVNAVLRKIAKPATLAADIAEQAHPDWLLARWRRSYGKTATQIICDYDQNVPPACLRVARPSEETQLQAEGVELQPSAFLRNARVATGRLGEIAAFKKGQVRTQDEGSQLVAELAGFGNDILDCCAAPGGKTAVLAENNPNASILACDINADRLRTMKKLLASSGVRTQIEYRQADAEKLPNDMKERFDLVLCDVPCSGTGTLARNPEIRHRVSIASIRDQQARQKRILRSALQTVKPGGRIVYSTCSLEPEENEDVVAALLQERPDVRQIDVRERLSELDAAGRLRDGAAVHLSEQAVKDKALHLLPGAFRCDGFFAAVLARQG